jgi:hypothetical protein
MLFILIGQQREIRKIKNILGTTGSVEIIVSTIILQ